MRRVLLASCLLFLSAPAARADKLVLVAGGGDGPDGTEATKAKLIQPFGVDFLGDRILIVEMAKGERLRAIGPDGKLVTLAGSEGKKGNDGDAGPGAKATFNGMHSLAVGLFDNIYLADTWNNRVRVYSPSVDRVRPFAGRYEKGFKGDGGPAADAQFDGVFCIGFDPDKKDLYITDLGNKRIRKV
ncbi:MAG: hypothetical protein J0I06_27645, partial [Planctomycetes bacterium]|nr:hypothetical protein [Planctomycetota bacterium]